MREIQKSPTLVGNPFQARNLKAASSSRDGYAGRAAEARPPKRHQVPGELGCNPPNRTPGELGALPPQPQTPGELGALPPTHGELGALPEPQTPGELGCNLP